MTLSSPHDHASGRAAPAAADQDFWDDPEMSGAAAPPGSWRGRPPLSIRFGNPTRMFTVAASLLAPLAPIRYLILPFAAFAGIAATFNWLDLQADLARTVFTISFLQGYILGLITTNLLSKLCQGIVMARHGAFCDEIGFRLAFGIMPKFYIFKGSIRQLQPADQQTCYAAPLLFKLFVFATGILVWVVLRSSGSSITDYAISIGMAGLSAFLFTANPLFPADGYRWLAARLGRPKLRTQSFKVLGMVITFKKIPPALPRSEFWLLFLFGLGSLTFTAAIIFTVIFSIALGLEAELGGTGVVIFCFMLAAVAMFVSALIEKRSGRGRKAKGRKR